jgi:hypothetical protein
MVVTLILIRVVGYKPAAGKTVDEYRQLDAGDDSLARWKASLGLDSAAGGDTTLPKVVLFFFLPIAHYFHLYFAHIAYHPELGADLSHSA